MPKENTHLFFAKNIQQKEIQYIGEIINRNISFFYLGSIAPDTFFYSKDKKIQGISDYIHGKDGNKTNKFIFQLLEIAKETHNEKIFSFILGLLTHFSLDIVFHPVIFSLTGNFYDSDDLKRKKAVFNHRTIEVSLDQKVSQYFYFNKLINLNTLQDETLLQALSGVLKLKKDEIQSSFERQIYLNKIFHKKFFWLIAKFLFKTGFIQKEELSLFYRAIPQNQTIKDGLEYKDLFSGEDLKIKISDLFEKASINTVLAFDSAYRFFNNEIDLKEVAINIKGENLDTGDIELSTKDIKFIK